MPAGGVEGSMLGGLGDEGGANGKAGKTRERTESGGPESPIGG